MVPEKNLTFGEETVGIGFNPSGNSVVDELKRLYARAIDIVNDNPPTDGFGKVLNDMSIQETLKAQMMAVKAVTWHKQ